jgi:hypothetical protein
MVAHFSQLHQQTVQSFPSIGGSLCALCSTVTVSAATSAATSAVTSAATTTTTITTELCFDLFQHVGLAQQQFLRPMLLDLCHAKSSNINKKKGQQRQQQPRITTTNQPTNPTTPTTHVPNGQPHTVFFGH